MESPDGYVSISKVSSNIKTFEDEFEIWLNNNLIFVFTWEKNMFPEQSIQPIEYTSYSDWVDSDSVSLVKGADGNIYIHPHILLAYSLSDPITNLLFIINIFKLPENLLYDLLTSIYINK